MLSEGKGIAKMEELVCMEEVHTIQILHPIQALVDLFLLVMY